MQEERKHQTLVSWMRIRSFACKTLNAELEYFS